MDDFDVVGWIKILARMICCLVALYLANQRVVFAPFGTRSTNRDFHIHRLCLNSKDQADIVCTHEKKS